MADKEGENPKVVYALLPRTGVRSAWPRVATGTKRVVHRRVSLHRRGVLSRHRFPMVRLGWCRPAISFPRSGLLRSVGCFGVDRVDRAVVARPAGGFIA